MTTRTDQTDAAHREMRRRSLEHRIAIQASIDTIAVTCIFSHRDLAHPSPWYACPPDVAADIADELAYLSLCGLIDVIHGDVQLIRIKEEMLT